MDHDKLLVKPGKTIRLDDFDPRYTDDFSNKDDARKKLSADIDRLEELQELLAAAATRAVLIVLQGMDTSGKDGAIKHVMSGLNPQGVAVFSFKVPTAHELAHDFLWRYERVVPERGRIGVFNRSYYEEVLVVRVHRDLLANEEPGLRTEGEDIWEGRFEDINAFERHLKRNGTEIVKFFLNVSKDEQRERLLARLDDPKKLWKFSLSDVRERRYWDRYRDAYEEMLNATSTHWAPWYIVPADHKWFMRTVIADVIVEHLRALDLHYPDPKSQRQMFDGIRAELQRDKPS